MSRLSPAPPSATRHPLVLMHGFGALAGVLSGGVLQREARHLRALGVAAFAPTVAPYGTLDERADGWGAHLARILRETGAERLNLLAFSSGGLDARLVARRPAWAGRIASLVTLSTPHRGNPLAAWALDRPDRLARVVLAGMQSAGRLAWKEPPRIADALAGLTPETVAARFPSDEAVDGAWCGSYTSAAGGGTPATLHPGLVVPHRLLARLSGASDGIVPTASMAWGDVLGHVEADHARQVGIALWPSRLYRSTDFVAAHAERLRTRGL